MKVLVGMHTDTFRPARQSRSNNGVYNVGMGETYPQHQTEREAVQPSDDRTPARYERRARMCASGVRWLYGVDVDEETKKRWGSLIYMTKYIDTYLDRSQQGDVPWRVAQMRQLLHQDETVAQLFPHLSRECVGDVTYEQMQRYGDETIQLKQRISAAATPNHYLQWRKLEGRTYARLIGCVATDYVQSQTQYERFRNHLVAIGEIANMTDSFTDLGDDARHGEITVTPSMSMRIQLLGGAAVALIRYPETARRNAKRPR